MLIPFVSSKKQACKVKIATESRNKRLKQYKFKPMIVSTSRYQRISTTRSLVKNSQFVFTIPKLRAQMRRLVRATQFVSIKTLVLREMEIILHPFLPPQHVLVVRSPRLRYCCFDKSPPGQCSNLYAVDIIHRRRLRQPERIHLLHRR